MWGPSRRAAHCCYEHDDQTFASLLGPRARSSLQSRAPEVPLRPISNDVEEIDSDEEERILSCAAAADVAKAKGRFGSGRGVMAAVA